jgi:ATP/ADP translocase
MGTLVSTVTLVTFATIIPLVTLVSILTFLPCIYSGHYGSLYNGYLGLFPWG